MKLKEKLIKFFNEEDFVFEGKLLDNLVSFVQQERADAYQHGYDDARFFVEDEVV